MAKIRRHRALVVRLAGAFRGAWGTTGPQSTFSTHIAANHQKALHE